MCENKHQNTQSRDKTHDLLMVYNKWLADKINGWINELLHDLLSFKILPVIVMLHIKQLNHFAYQIKNVFKLSFFHFNNFKF